MDRIELTAEDRAMLKLHMARMQCYKQLMQIEETQVALLLMKSYGIDVNKDHWNLDIEQGVLERVRPGM